MNKLLVLISLFLSSFFLFSFSVSAATANIDISEDTYNLINDTFFTVKEEVEEYAKNNNFNTYFITYSSNSYNVLFYNNTNNSNFICSLSSDLSCVFYKAFTTGSYRENSGLVVGGTTSSLIINSSSYKNYLYSNIGLKIIDSSTSLLNLNYNGRTYEFVGGDTIYSIYDIYIDINNSSVDELHKEELNILSNFYNTVIDKLDYISEVFASNYIYLSILVIFLLIFVFELIFRRFL